MICKEDIHKVIKSLGLVFGDIGTSPIYTLTVIFLLLTQTLKQTIPTVPQIMGVVSLIIWTLILLVSVEYAWLAMSLGKKGEGGTIVLKEILVPLLRKGRSVGLIVILTYIGVSLLIGDGIITPAISILSAVEGIKLIPSLANISQSALITLASIIAIVLFWFQKKGTEKVAGAFGPLMVLWFTFLTVSGAISISHCPQILNAINPYYAVKFLATNGVIGFLTLSEVILCATGGEALYADMGHLGRWPIIRAWVFVFIALVTCYLGQGAFIIEHLGAKNILFEMINTQSHFLYIPFLLLSIMATVIASQAMISGMFSIVYQGITTRIMPMFKVDYTSAELRTQIYIGFVNWFLLVFVLVVMLYFKESSKLAAAYGLAVTGTMTITGIMMSWIFYLRKKPIKCASAILITFVDLAFLISNMYKIPHGGWISLVLALCPLLIILIYTAGQKKLYKNLKPIKLEDFLPKYNQIYAEAYRIRGTALFFARDSKMIPPYIVNTMFQNNIIYQDNILVSINIGEDPFGILGEFKEDIAEGLRYFEVKMGYMEVIDVEKILKETKIEEKVIFYGLEDIFTENPLWKIFAIIKKNTPSFVQFYSLPSNKLHGVITRVEL